MSPLNVTLGLSMAALASIGITQGVLDTTVAVTLGIAGPLTAMTLAVVGYSHGPDCWRNPYKLVLIKGVCACQGNSLNSCGDWLVRRMDIK